MPSPNSAEELQAHLRSFENQFDSAQTTMRQIASVWLLATIGAFAYLLVNADACTNNPMSRGFTVCIVALLGAMGLTLLWFQDQWVYQRLLHSVFVFGLKLEHDRTELRPLRGAMYTSNGNVIRWQSLYYLIPLTLLVGFAASVTIFQLFDCPKAGPKWAASEQQIAMWMLIAAGVALLYVIGSSLSNGSFRNLVALYDPAFQRFVEDDRFADRLKRDF